MRERTVLRLDNAGLATRTEIVLEDASVEQRFKELLEVAPSVGEPQAIVLWVVCNGCGLRLEIHECALPDGWTSNERGEFCAQCA